MDDNTIDNYVSFRSYAAPVHAHEVRCIRKPITLNRDVIREVCLMSAGFKQVLRSVQFNCLQEVLSLPVSREIQTSHKRQNRAIRMN